MSLIIKDLIPFTTYAVFNNRKREFKHYARVLDVSWEDDSLKSAVVEIVLEPASYLNGVEYAKREHLCLYKDIPEPVRDYIEFGRIGR